MYIYIMSITGKLGYTFRGFHRALWVLYTTLKVIFT